MLNQIKDIAKFLAPISGMLKKTLFLTTAAAVPIAIFSLGPVWLQAITASLIGSFSGLTFMILAAPLFKEQLKFDTERVKDSPESNKWKMLLEVQPGRHSVIMRGGHPRYVIEGGEIKKKSLNGQQTEEIQGGTPEKEDAGEGFLAGLWHRWQTYMHKYTGYHPYIPFFDKPYTYRLPRYELAVGEKGGVDAKTYVFKEDVSDHVRVETTTWYFEYHSVDIQKVPFLVRGSVQFCIIKGKEKTALFEINEWNVLLDQALNGAVRGYVKANLTLDDVLGETPKDLWDKAEKTGLDTIGIADGILKLLQEYKINTIGENDTPQGKSLPDLGINIQRVEIIDFADELPDGQREQFFAAVIGREKGRARSLEGQGTAEAEKKLLDVHKDGGDASKTIIENRAFVDAVKGSDVLAALAGRLAQKK